MPADRSGGRAGRIEQHGVERPSLPFRDVGRDDFGVQTEPREIVAQPREPAGGAVDRRDAGAGMRELRGLAAGRGAEIGDLRTRTSPSSRAGSAAAASCTHHSPSTIAGQQRDRAVRDGAHACLSAARARAGARPSCAGSFSP